MQRVPYRSFLAPAVARYKANQSTYVVYSPTRNSICWSCTRTDIYSAGAVPSPWAAEVYRRGSPYIWCTAIFQYKPQLSGPTERVAYAVWKPMTNSNKALSCRVADTPILSSTEALVLKTKVQTLGQRACTV